MEKEILEPGLLDKFFIWLRWTIMTCGIALIVFAVMSYKGMATPFSTIETMQLNDSIQEVAKTLADVQDIQTSMAMRLKDAEAGRKSAAVKKADNNG